VKEKTFGNSFQTGSSTKKNTQMTFKIPFFAEFHSVPNLGMGYSEILVELSAAQKLLKFLNFFQVKACAGMGEGDSSLNHSYDDYLRARVNSQWGFAEI
jgi:hypothetical protein